MFVDPVPHHPCAAGGGQRPRAHRGGLRDWDGGVAGARRGEEKKKEL